MRKSSAAIRACQANNEALIMVYCGLAQSRMSGAYTDLPDRAIYITSELPNSAMDLKHLCIGLFFVVSLEAIAGVLECTGA